MAETQLFKNFYDVELARMIASKILPLYPAFPSEQFVSQVAAQINPLELKARVRVMAAELRAALPPEYPRALEILLATLGQENDETEGMFNTGYWVAPIADFVEVYGLDDFDASMRGIYEITKRYTSEFAVRPYLIQYPDKTLARLRPWVGDPNPHVRRFVSEGTRPRLPWGKRLDMFVREPQPVLELLEHLKDDPSAYVRKSVANNLNDITKDHPGRVLALFERWKIDASGERRWIIKHALRTLIKKGDPSALGLLGYQHEASFRLEHFEIQPSAVTIGDSLKLNLGLTHSGSEAQDAVIDYRIHFLKANGKSSPKVFKWTARSFAPGETVALTKAVSMRPVTTRTYYPGLHLVDVQVNGQILGETTFELQSEE